VDEVRRDAQRINIMKNALKAKRRYLVASARADSDLTGVAGLEEAAAAEEEGWGDDDEVAAPRAGAGGARAPARTASRSVGKPSVPRASLRSLGAAAAAVAAPAAAPGPATKRDDEDWGEEAPAHSTGAAALGPVVSGGHHDESGALPSGWTIQMDETDRWYYNESTGETSCECCSPCCCCCFCRCLCTRGACPLSNCAHTDGGGGLDATTAFVASVADRGKTEVRSLRCGNSAGRHPANADTLDLRQRQCQMSCARD